MGEPPKWYDPKAENPRWINALAEVCRLAPREGWCFHHVQAIIVSVDRVCGSRHRQPPFLSQQAAKHRLNYFWTQVKRVPFLVVPMARFPFF
jgi:hypothetical protein